MFQNFLLKKMLKAQGVPEAQIDLFIKMVEKNPELFKNIAAETEAKIKAGASREHAGLEVLQKYEKEIKNLL